MSYFPADPISPTPGLAFEAFLPSLTNPMAPHEHYSMRAAGPAHLTTAFGQTPGLETLGAQAEAALRGVVVAGVNAAWPDIERRLQPRLSLFGTMQVISTVAAVGALLASVALLTRAYSSSGRM
jgi:hypothetical protein